MRARSSLLGILLILASLPSAVGAQEGYPLVGTWTGYWGRTPSHRQFLTVIMSWDGHSVSGLVNPGPNAGTLRSVKLNSSDWTVEMVMDVKDASGASIRLTAAGRLENIGSYNRSVSGVWQDGQDSGIFRISRQ